MMDLSRPLISPTEQLLEILPRFNFQTPPIDPNELAHILSQTAIKYDKMSLSAIELGLPYRAFVIKAQPMICCFNPLIVDKTQEMVYLEECCSSYPGIILKKNRPKMIKVRYSEPNGSVQTKKMIGLTARLFQHELDHLNGKQFHFGQTRLALEIAIRKAKKAGFNYAQKDFKQEQE